MEFLLPPDLIEFRKILGEFFSENFPQDSLNRFIDSSAKPSGEKDPQALWKEISDLGAISAGSSEEFGGLGFGQIASSVVLEEASRRLIPLPLFETLSLGVTSLELIATKEQKAEYLTKALSGEFIVSGALEQIFSALTDGSLGPAATLSDRAKNRSFGAVSMKAKKQASPKDYLLSGTSPLVPNGRSANLLIIPAQLEDKEFGLFLITPASLSEKEVSFKDVDTLDLVRNYQDVALKNAPGVLLGTAALSTVQWEELSNRISALVVSELVGVATQIVSISVEYAKARQQFGKPIGSFQAIQHKLVNMHLVVEEATSLSRYANWCADNNKSELSKAVAAAKGYASEFIPTVAEDAIQVHGGIGFTYEYCLHLYLRRAQVLAHLYGLSADFYKKLGTELLNS
jgi:alkylation response protein AidB-like acyl-CoA dehydrogenase